MTERVIYGVAVQVELDLPAPLSGAQQIIPGQEALPLKLKSWNGMREPDDVDWVEHYESHGRSVVLSRGRGSGEAGEEQVWIFEVPGVVLFRYRTGIPTVYFSELYGRNTGAVTK